MVCSGALEHLEELLALADSSCHLLGALGFSHQGNAPTFDEIVRSG